MTKDEQITEEIANHGKTWCSPNCKVGDTFLPNEYREKRQRYSATVVQGQYDLCHIWR